MRARVRFSLFPIECHTWNFDLIWLCSNTAQLPLPLFSPHNDYIFDCIVVYWWFQIAISTTQRLHTHTHTHEIFYLFRLMRLTDKQQSRAWNTSVCIIIIIIIIIERKYSLSCCGTIKQLSMAFEFMEIVKIVHNWHINWKHTFRKSKYVKECRPFSKRIFIKYFENFKKHFVCHS